MWVHGENWLRFPLLLIANTHVMSNSKILIKDF